MKASGDLGITCMTDLIIPDNLRNSSLFPVYKGKGNTLMCVHEELSSYWSSL